MYIKTIDGEIINSEHFSTFEIVEYSGGFVVAAMLDNKPSKTIIIFDDKNEAQKILDQIFLSLGAKTNVRTWDVNIYVKDGKLLI